MAIDKNANPEAIADAIINNQGRLLDAGLDAVLEAISDIAELIGLLMEKNKHSASGPSRIANGGRIEALLKLQQLLIVAMQKFMATERAKRAASLVDDIISKQTKGLGKK